ncbi:MAG TPA: hypothetical protein VF273_08040 [Pelobium sp.]
MKLTFVLLFICLVNFKVCAQEDSLKKTTLTLALMYNSNVSYYGQATNDKFPYVLANASLRLPFGLYFSAGSYKLLNYGSGLSETDFGMGYEYDFNDKFNMGIAYTRSFFPANSPLLQAANENNISLTNSYNWGWFKSSLNTDYAFGKQRDVFVSLNNAKEISLGSFLNDKNQIFIEPALELSAGTQRYYETYIIEKGKRGQSKGKGKGLDMQQGNDVTSAVETDKFSLLAYNFAFPLSLLRANYIAEVSYQLSVLGAQSQTELKPVQSFFGVAFYYQF